MISNPINPNFLTPSQAAQIIGCSADNVVYLARRGRLQVALMTRAGRLFHRTDVDDYARERAERCAQRELAPAETTTA